MILIPRPALVVAVVTALALSGCGGNDDDSRSSTGRLDVVASFSPLAEAARQVGGDRVDVVDLTPPGAEPHDLELTTGQVDDLEDADLVLVMGRDFQPAVEEIAGRRDGATVVVLDALDLGDVRSDPHVWLDPILMAEIVAAVEAELAEIDTDGVSTYVANAEAFRARLDALDHDFETGLASCERREILTAHEAFGWMAKRYDLEQHAIAGIEPDQEPSADRLADLADFARDNGTTTVFTEELVSPEVAETLAREAGGLRTEVLDPIEGLSDEEREAGDDYVSLMRANLAKLREALACS